MDLVWRYWINRVGLCDLNRCLAAVMGFPFFAPAFVPTNALHFYGGHDIEAALRRQQQDPSFPVPLEWMGASREFNLMKEGEVVSLTDWAVSMKKQPHHGDSYGFRFEHEGKVVVYTTDAEHKLDDIEGMEITRATSEKLFHFSFKLAQRRKAAGKPGRLTCVDKANVLGSTAFFRQIFDEVGEHYPDVERDYGYIDAVAMWFWRGPANETLYIIAVALLGTVAALVFAMKIQGQMKMR